MKFYCAKIFVLASAPFLFPPLHELLLLVTIILVRLAILSPYSCFMLTGTGKYNFVIRFYLKVSISVGSLHLELHLLVLGSLLLVHWKHSNSVLSTSMDTALVMWDTAVKFLHL